MTSDIKKISRELQERRTLLLERYDDEDLHQLRINIRRVRSLLKGNPDQRARKLRKEWGKIADYTNAARDWDTLARYTDDALPAKAREQLGPLIGSHCRLAHTKVLEMLESEDWNRALEHWLKHAHKGGNDLLQEASELPDAGKTATRAWRASRRALEHGDETSWHKFRIAIKDLRYTLDNPDLTDKSLRAKTKTTLKLCKHLQQALGDWHDSVVHRTLLEQLVEDPTVTGNADLVSALDTLQTINRERGDSALSKVRQLVDEKGGRLAAVADSI